MVFRVVGHELMPPLRMSTLHDVAHFAVEFVRNRLAGTPAATVLLPSPGQAPWLHDVWRSTSRPPGKLWWDGSMPPGERPDLAVVAAGGGPSFSCREALMLPGADRTRIHTEGPILELSLGRGPSTVVLVPGTAHGPSHLLTAAALGRLRAAELRAQTNEVRAVLLSGWGGPKARVTEAEQLRAAWQGQVVPLVMDTAARSTAENVLFAAALVSRISDVHNLILISSWSNALRAHLLALLAFRGTHVAVQSQILWGRAHAASLIPGTVGLLWMFLHLHRGRQLLLRGPGHVRPESL